MKAASFVLLSFLAVTGAQVSSKTFRIPSDRQRSLTTVIENADQATLSLSDDGDSKELYPFIIDIFDTAGLLTEAAVLEFTLAVNNFLFLEFNQTYPNEIYSISSEVLGQQAIDSPTRVRRGLTGGGTALETAVTVVFDSEPSPRKEIVEDVLRDDITTDLTHLVTNITRSPHLELANVHSARRRELPTPSPTGAPTDSDVDTNPITGPEDNGGEGEQGQGNAATGVVSGALAAATLLALTVYFIFRRKERDAEVDETEAPKGSMMYVDVENDLYSLDRSMGDGQSPNADSAQYSTSADGSSLLEDSVFSGIDSPTNTQARTSKSLLSGFTNASASTFRVSNTERAKERATKKAMAVPGSLYAYSEEDYDDFDNDELLGKGNPPRLAGSDVSDGEDDAENQMVTLMGSESSSLQGAGIEEPPTSTTNTSSMFSCYGQAQPSPATSDHVLADLEDLEASKTGSGARDPTPTALKGSTRDPTPSNRNVVVSYNPFNCNPILPSQPCQQEGLVSATTPTTFSAKASRAPESGTKETPLRRNHFSPAGEDSPTNNIGAMSAKATQIMGGVYGESGVESRARANSMGGNSRPTTPASAYSGNKSEPSTPDRVQIGGHWLRAGRPPVSPPNEGDYMENLSRPSTPGGELNSSLQVSDYESSSYGCLPFGRVVNRTPDKDMPILGAGEEIVPGSGRRHAGNNDNIDGSAMYQTSAMHPLDWSYKSADLNSVGDSTISAENDNGMPRQFIFSGKREDPLDTSGGPKTPNSARTGVSRDTNGSSHTSASKQLINDLVWLEKKIADVKHSPSSDHIPPRVHQTDSLSYASGDDENYVSRIDSQDSQEDPTIYSNKDGSVMSSIVCRDCYAPPGKLHIVIHSTKDGPAVHTVKEGSSLEGHVFPGDLIISVDNIDTRSFTAEQVMQMMASKSESERKITVLHFEEEE